MTTEKRKRGRPRKDSYFPEDASSVSAVKAAHVRAYENSNSALRQLLHSPGTGAHRPWMTVGQNTFTGQPVTMPSPSSLPTTNSIDRLMSMEDQEDRIRQQDQFLRDQEQAHRQQSSIDHSVAVMPSPASTSNRYNPPVPVTSPPLPAGLNPTPTLSDGGRYACEPCVRGSVISLCDHIGKLLNLLLKRGYVC